MIGFVSSNYGESCQITLAVVVSLIEFAVVMDGVGMALQPLIGTYFGERNHVLIKRVMKSGAKAAVAEGIIATLFIWIFAGQFCALFGVTTEPALSPTITALRIVSLGFVFCSMVSLTTSYYMLIDHIGMATCFACLHNGVFYVLLPMLGSLAFGINGMWAGFAAAPMVALACAYLFVYLRFGKDNFPFLLKDMDSEIEVLDDTLTPQTTAALSERVESILLAHNYPKKTSTRAALFVEEMGMAILDANKDTKKPILIELSLFFDPGSVLIIQRDSGKLFDITDPDHEIQGLNGALLNGIVSSLDERAYLVTTGYNRHMVRFTQG
jgi:anti-sigma regulatory factor (Ser/Thr protein kinase)